MATQSLNTFYEDIFWGNAQANPETAIADTTYYPASTLFFNVSGFEQFTYLIKVGGIDSATTFQVRQDTSATVTGSVKDVTGAVVVVGTGDDGEQFSITVNTDQLDVANGFIYVTLYATGAAGSNDYAAITFLAYGARNYPVTQTSNYPSGNAVNLLA